VGAGALIVVYPVVIVGHVDKERLSVSVFLPYGRMTLSGAKAAYDMTRFLSSAVVDDGEPGCFLHVARLRTPSDHTKYWGDSLPAFIKSPA
jgi:hypothetical protein